MVAKSPWMIPVLMLVGSGDPGHAKTPQSPGDSARVPLVAALDSAKGAATLDSAEVAWNRRDYASASSLYTEYLEYDPTDVSAAFRAGMSRYRLGETAAAKRGFLRAVSVDSLHVNSNRMLYRLYRGESKMDSAAQSLERALSADPESEQVRGQLSDLYGSMARTFWGNRDYASAAAFYARHLEHSVSDTTAWFYLGMSQYNLGNRRAAKAALLRAVALDSLNGDANLLLCRIYQEDSQPDSAAQSLERILVGAPDDHGVRRRLAEMCRALGRSREAIGHYEHIAASGEDDPKLLGSLVQLYEGVDQNKAVEWQRRLVRRLQSGSTTAPAGDRTPADSEARNAEIELQLLMGDRTEALGTLMELARLDSSEGYLHYRRAARLALELGDEEARIEALRGMVRRDERDLGSIAQLAEWYLGRDQYSEAETWIDRGLGVDSTSAHLQVLRGDVLAQRGDEDEAISCFLKAQADPEWRAIAQQRIWQLRPPETAEEKLKRGFFGTGQDQ